MKNDYLQETSLLDMTTVAATTNFEGRQVDAERAVMRGAIMHAMIRMLTPEQLEAVHADAKGLIGRRVEHVLAANETRAEGEQ